MTRVTENSNAAALKFSINRAKNKMEDLQIKGTSLKRITKPSDDPVSNVQSLTIKSTNVDNKQYLRNTEYALLQLNTTEKALEQLTEILIRGKEIALAQSSDLYGGDVRKNVASEVIQLKNQILAIANKRVGNRYIFAGHSTLSSPFTADGNYSGDEGHINLEVSKDFFVPINIPGSEVFFTSKNSSMYENEKDLIRLQDNEKDIESSIKDIGRQLASTDAPQSEKYGHSSNIFSIFSNLIAGLENDDATIIQETLEKFDIAISRLVTLRTRIGSLASAVHHSRNSIESENLLNKERESQLVDADIADLFSDLVKQQDILRTAYMTGKGLIKQTLLDFIS